MVAKWKQQKLSTENGWNISLDDAMIIFRFSPVGGIMSFETLGQNLRRYPPEV